MLLGLSSVTDWISSAAEEGSSLNTIFDDSETTVGNSDLQPGVFDAL